MVSFEGPHALRIMGKVLMLAVLSAARTGFSQPVPEPTADRQQQIFSAIEREQSQNGIHSAGLLGPLTALAVNYREDGDDSLALAAYERARQVVRVNYGLSSIEEAPLLQQLVRIEEARGDLEAAWDLEQQLIALVRRHPENARIAPILHEIADKRMDVLREYSTGQGFPPQIVLGCYYRGQANAGWIGATQRRQSCTSGSRSAVIRGLAREAQSYRALAIHALVSNELYDSEMLRELELEALRFGGAYRCPSVPLQELLATPIIGGCLDPIASRSRGGPPIFNVGGSASLIRLLIYEIRSSAPALSQVNALVRLADSQLAFSDAGASTLALYQVAHHQAVAAGLGQAAIDEIFAPPTPVLLATHRRPDRIGPRTSDADLLIAAEAPASDGYVDVAFDITGSGASQDIEILDAAADASRAAKKTLVRSIERSVFRPRVSDGRFADSARVTVRYYLND